MPPPGKLIGEYSNATAAIQETVYLNDIPLAILQGSNVYYLYADHLNPPRNIIDQSNRVIWAGAVICSARSRHQCRQASKSVTVE